MSYLLNTITAAELGKLRAAALASRLGIIVPVGAVEQHGPYLPVTCDTDIANGAAVALAESLASRECCRAWVAPAVSYGPVPGAERTNGTASVGFSELGDYLAAVTSGFAASGTWDLIVIVNAHGHNHGRAIEASSATYKRYRIPVFVLHVYEYVHLCDGTDIEPGSHGGEFEIALHNHYASTGRPTGELPILPPPRPRPRTAYGLDLMPRSYEGILASTPPSIDRALAASEELGRRLDEAMISRLEADVALYFEHWQPTDGFGVCPS